MKRTSVFLLFFLCLIPRIAAQNDFSTLTADKYPVTTAGLPQFTLQSEGRISAVRLAYPEYAPLSSEEVHIIRKQNLQVQEDSIVVTLNTGSVRKKVLTDISFSPILRRKGSYMRLVSCKITPIYSATPTTGTKASPQSISTRYAAQSVLSTGKWVKIRVRQEGLYALSAATLGSYGFTDLSRIKVYGYGGRLLPENFRFSGTDALIDDLCEVPLLRRGSDVVFFAEGTIRYSASTHRQNYYSDYSYYFVTEGDTPAPLPTSRQQTSYSEITAVPAMAVLDNDEYFWYNGGREMYDSYDFYNGNTHTFRVSVPGLASPAGHVDIGFSASDQLLSTTAEVSIDGQPLHTFRFTAYDKETESAHEAKGSFSTDALSEETPFTFKVTANRHARLNYIRVRYNRTLDGRETGYAFSPSRPGELLVSNATAGTAVWMLAENGTGLCRLEGDLEGDQLRVAVSDDSRRYVIVDENAAYPAPQIVGEIENQNLHADTPADMVIIIPESGKLEAEAQRLARLHEELQGLRVRVVRADRIYNEFSSGTPDATAYRRYLKMLYDRAEREEDLPRFLILFGDCLYDNRLRTAEMKRYDTKDFLLAYEKNDLWDNSSYASIGTLRSYVSDDYFGFLDDGEGSDITREKLDLAIGRFPCHDAAKAKVYVDKCERYLRNENVGTWKNQAVAIGDFGNNNLHMEDAERVTSQIRSVTGNRFQISRLYLDSYTAVTTATGRTFPKANEQARKWLDRSALLFNYSGHGNPSQISKSFLLTTKDFENITSPSLPLWIFASCEIAPYDELSNNIGRAAIDNARGAAIAVICASRTVYATLNNNLNLPLSRHLLTPGTPIGEALRLAKVQMVDLSTDVTINKLKYVLLGNPALSLSMPQARVVIDSINGIPLGPAADIELQACSTARFSGHIETAGGQRLPEFKGLVTGTLQDRSETIICKNNDGSATKPMTYEERTSQIAEITDSVTGGRFSFRIVLPRDISYSRDAARLSLYAVSADRRTEAHGYTQRIHLDGTDTAAAVDTVGPKVFIYLNAPDFPDGGTTGPDALFVAEISDSTGINASGSGLGKELSLVIDGTDQLSYTLNDYFSYDFGDYLRGKVEFPLTGLSQGRHTLSFRVWDINQNSTTSTLTFFVGNAGNSVYDVSLTHQAVRSRATFVTTLPGDTDEGSVTIDVYDIGGRHVWSGQTYVPAGASYSAIPWAVCDFSGTPLPDGIYLYRSKFSGSQSHKSDTKKMIIRR